MSTLLTPSGTRTRALRTRSVVCAALLMAGAATLATSFTALGPAVLVLCATAWAAAVLWGAAAPGVVPLTVVSCCVKAVTILSVLLIVIDPRIAVGPTAWFDWIPLGAANAASGLWFLALIRKRAA